MDSLSHADQAESVWRRSHLQRTKDTLKRIGLILSNVDGNQRTPSESPPKEAATKRTPWIHHQLQIWFNIAQAIIPNLRAPTGMDSLSRIP